MGPIQLKIEIVAKRRWSK